MSSTGEESKISKELDWEALKGKGNESFKHGHYAEAVDFYSQAIEAAGEGRDGTAVLWTNRAFANLKLDRFGDVIEDATRALTLDARAVKAYYHRAAAFMGLGQFPKAIRDYKRVVQLAPSQKDAKIKLATCERIYKEALLSEAVHVDEAQSRRDAQKAMQSLAQTVVDAAYAGPRWAQDEPISLEFVRAMMDWFRDGGALPVAYYARLLLEAMTLLEAEPNVPDVPVGAGETVRVFGDIHGQYYDLLHAFDKIGVPGPGKTTIFNGDFVDRGAWGVEVIATLLAFKVLYPEHTHLNRGNHESRSQNRVYSFGPEAIAKCGGAVMEMFSELFTCLPLAHTIGKRVFVVHGGIFAEDGVKLSDLAKINRFREPPIEGPMSDMLWSDPQPTPGRLPSKRGVGKSYGPDVTKRFCDDNGLDFIVRSHEVMEQGYEIMHDGRCITVFSAPNYCDVSGNKAAVLLVGNDFKPSFVQFDAVPHPKAPSYGSGMYS